MKSPLLVLPHSFGMCDNLINFDLVHIIKLNKMMLNTNDTLPTFIVKLG